MSLIGPIANELWRARAASVLELGIGMGIYGAVVRQWLDNGVQPYKTKLVGVEGFIGYKNPCWRLYDNVVHGLIEDYLRTDTSFWDAILILDVIEHFERSDGVLVIQAAKRRLSAYGQLYIGTPAVWMEQGAAHGNELERHRSVWTAAELRSLDFEIMDDGATPDMLGNQMLLARYRRP